MSQWNKVAKPIVVLSLMCLLVTAALAGTNYMTAPVIEAATLAAAEAARAELLPDATGFTQIHYEGEGVTAIYEADNGVGTIITCKAKGYGGDITVMVAFAPEGGIQQIKIQEQSETAGLGTKITNESFWSSFSGLPSDTAIALEDIDAVTGATISSKAVVAAVNYALEAYNSIS